jgi:AcrR family transcriptional regulator
MKSTKPESRGRAAAGRARPALSRPLILEAAFEIVAADGLAALSTRRLGQRLGCEAMSIYHHFRSKHHLLDAMVEHATQSVEVAAPVGERVADTAALRACMASYRAMARRWPALFPLIATHRLNMPAGARFIERVLTLIRALEPDPERAARVFRTLGYYLAGAGLDESAGYARGPSAAEPVSDEFIARECPSLMAAAPYFRPDHWDATFWFGADALLRELDDGAQRGAGPARAEAAGAGS